MGFSLSIRNLRGKAIGKDDTEMESYKRVALNVLRDLPPVEVFSADSEPDGGLT